jgi:spoIIIJ-associated protein
MSEDINSVEATGLTVEEAIEKGLNELGLLREEVNVEVLDEGNRGLFGIGTRDAHVRLTTRSEADDEDTEDEDYDEETGWEDVDNDEFEEEDEDDEEEPDPVVLVGEPEDDEQEDDYILDIARETVAELLEKMSVRARVKTSFEPDSSERRPSVKVDILGDDLSILIGRRAETLNALQYITRLILGKELGRSINLSVDVGGYRKRKEERLRTIAQNMARQAVETGKRQYLEPMPANERRIIHIELRDHPEVYTESTGEGNRRKVTISLKP